MFKSIITKDINQAKKEKDEFKLQTLQLLKMRLLNEEKKKNVNLSLADQRFFR